MWGKLGLSDSAWVKFLTGSSSGIFVAAWEELWLIQSSFHVGWFAAGQFRTFV